MKVVTTNRHLLKSEVAVGQDFGRLRSVQRLKLVGDQRGQELEREHYSWWWKVSQLKQQCTGLNKLYWTDDDPDTGGVSTPADFIAQIYYYRRLGGEFKAQFELLRYQTVAPRLAEQAVDGPYTQWPVYNSAGIKVGTSSRPVWHDWGPNRRFADRAADHVPWYRPRWFNLERMLSSPHPQERGWALLTKACAAARACAEWAGVIERTRLVPKFDRSDIRQYAGFRLGIAEAKLGVWNTEFEEMFGQGFSAGARLQGKRQGLKTREPRGTRVCIRAPSPPPVQGVLSQTVALQINSEPIVPLNATTVPALTKLKQASIENKLAQRNAPLYNEASASVTQNVIQTSVSPSFKAEVAEVRYEDNPKWLKRILGDDWATTINRKYWLGKQSTPWIKPDQHLVGLLAMEAGFKERTPKLLQSLIQFGRRSILEYGLTGYTSQEVTELVVASALTAYAGIPQVLNLASVYASDPYQSHVAKLNKLLLK
ncbi:hypothetical protein [Erysiphe necator associated tombus-like virus 6]|nr:hypothetical protein [Erysiphe necator associated tombus-like virus 6]